VSESNGAVFLETYVIIDDSGASAFATLESEARYLVARGLLGPYFSGDRISLR